MSEIKISFLSDKINTLLEEKLDKKIIEKLRNFIISYKTINDIYKIDPYQLSKTLDVDKNILIKILLNAVKIGLFDLNLDIYCEECNMIVKEFNLLNEIRGESHCPQCSLDIQIDLKKNSFASFTINEQIIKFNKQDALAEFNKLLFESKKTKSLEQRFSIINLISLQDFYSIFPDNNINPDQFFPIENITFLVSDVSNFSELLKKMNEKEAVLKVKKYIKIASDAVNKNNGSIIKTLGHTVMAIFSEKVNALKAGFDFLKELNIHITQNKPNVRISIISGSCYCYSVTDSLNYFGSIVNTALDIKYVTQKSSIIITKGIKEDMECLSEISRHTNSIKHAKTKIDNESDILDLFIVEV